MIEYDAMIEILRDTRRKVVSASHFIKEAHMSSKTISKIEKGSM